MSSRGNMISTGAVLLVLAGLGIAGGAMRARDAARAFADEGVAAILASRSTDDYTRRTAAPATPGQSGNIDRLQASLANMPALGALKSMSPASANLHAGLDGGPHLSADFQKSVQFEAGPMTASGSLVFGLRGWSFSSLSLLAEGPARKAIQDYITGLRSNGMHSDPARRVSALDGEGWELNNALQLQIEQMENTGNMQALDDLFAKAIATDEHVKDGRSKVSALGSALRDWVANGKWDQHLQTISRWRARNPPSGAAAIAEGFYWLHYAWDARGSGYADSITPEGDRLFQQRLRKASQALAEAKSIADSNPLWYSASMEVAIAQGQPDAAHTLFAEGRQRFPGAENIYYAEIRALQPRWFGSYAQEDALIADVTAATRARYGLEFYTRLYWKLDANEGAGFDLFHQAAIQWPLMKQGFDDIIKRNPDSLLMRNAYAAYACRANDAQTFHTVVAQLGSNIIPEDWGNRYSFDYCSHLFANVAPDTARELKF